MTNHWIDLQHSDVVLIQGSNAAENHPISFKWVMKAKDKGAKIIHVDPRYTRTSARSDNPARALLAWKDGKWVGDVPDGPWPPMAMEGGKLPFIMKPDGVSSLFGPGVGDGPFPEHYEPLESPLKKNPLSKQYNSPIIKIFKSDKDAVANL